MPKKGRREITVDGITYYYIVKKTYEHEYYGNKKASVTIEAPDGRIYADRSKRVSITPSYVKELILEHLTCKRHKIMPKQKSRIISVNEGHGTLNYDRVCKICGDKGTILCDGGFETCVNEKCKSHSMGRKK